MNREQRRAKLKMLGKKFTGLDITSGVLNVPLAGSDEFLTVNMMDFDVIYSVSEMVEKFSNLRENYKEDFEAVDSNRGIGLIRVYKKIVSDFSEYVDMIFGEGATQKIFGCKSPMPQVIAEFIEDLVPIVDACTVLIESENEGIQSNHGVGIKDYSSLREGNA